MKQVKTKYSIWWFTTTILFATIIWLIVNFMPNDGWIFWTGIIGIVLLIVAYLCLTVVIVTLYAVDAYKDEISLGFRKFGHSVMEAYNDHYASMWGKFYAHLERLSK